MNYSIRRARLSDIPFLAKTVMEAEKSATDKFSFSTLFNKSEAEALELIAAMFDEEVDGCELSVSSFLVIEFEGKPVAAFSGWIEQFEGESNSGLLKSNLIGYTFGRESLSFLMTKAHLVKDIQIEREANTLQIEYLFVAPEHRGKSLAHQLISKHIEEAIKQFPSIKKVQVQVFKNNLAAQKVYENCGFSIVKSAKSNDTEILDYLPSDEKYLMEKELN
ncbi:GNAT family N-acetyltransferase [Flavobacterium wongokense]|uniref:GNAT family N-acetyltransferase n=1 Tax=Flavobacterium wongokense TaxID=2910674 RepID=UPI001F3C38A1|nr:GNAT family N-acetyltransferase [Flavobacterium sp. WG47]MCF6132538.1 GNAT family N-acetyltransferase [Flavobacterium sp. WG47]